MRSKISNWQEYNLKRKKWMNVSQKKKWDRLFELSSTNSSDLSKHHPHRHKAVWILEQIAGKFNICIDYKLPLLLTSFSIFACSPVIFWCGWIVKLFMRLFRTTDKYWILWSFCFSERWNVQLQRNKLLKNL